MENKKIIKYKEKLEAKKYKNIIEKLTSLRKKRRLRMGF